MAALTLFRSRAVLRFGCPPPLLAPPSPPPSSSAFPLSRRMLTTTTKTSQRVAVAVVRWCPHKHTSAPCFHFCSVLCVRVCACVHDNESINSTCTRLGNTHLLTSTPSLRPRPMVTASAPTRALATGEEEEKIPKPRRLAFCFLFLLMFVCCSNVRRYACVYISCNDFKPTSTAPTPLNGGKAHKGLEAEGATGECGRAASLKGDNVPPSSPPLRATAAASFSSPP